MVNCDLFAWRDGRVPGLEEGELVVEADVGWTEKLQLDFAPVVAVDHGGSVAWNITTYKYRSSRWIRNMDLSMDYL